MSGAFVSWTANSSWVGEAGELMLKGLGALGMENSSSGESGVLCGLGRADAFDDLSSLLGRLDPLSNGPLRTLLKLFFLDPPGALIGLRGSSVWMSGLEPLREEDWLAFEAFRLLILAVGNGGNAQSRFAESSGLGGRSQRRGIGLVILRFGGALLPPLLAERILDAGD